MYSITDIYFEGVVCNMLYLKLSAHFTKLLSFTGEAGKDSKAYGWSTEASKI